MIDYFDTGDGFFTDSEIYVDRHLNRGTPPHAHQFIEIAYIAAGQGLHIINGTEYTCAAGDLFIINRDDPHQFISPDASVMEIYNCIFSAGYTRGYFTGQKRIFDISNRFLLSVLAGEIPLENPKITFQPPFRENVEELIKTMLAEYTDRPEGWTDILRAKLVELIVFILRAVGGGDYSETPGQHDEALDRAIEFIHRKFKDDLTVGELALICLLSPSHFARLFKEKTGKSVKEYIQNIRISNACRLLRESKLKIIDVAGECGYTDLKYFGVLFKNTTGSTPSEYRRGVN